MKARRRWLTALLLLASCAGAPPLPAPDASHPASPLADEAPESAPSQTLVMPERLPPQSAGRAGRGH